MSARTAPPEGWVTVAAAAEQLSRAGDPIDPSNVSRYLARFPDIPQEKIGKFRFVDPAALTRHRRTNVLVGEKQASRDLLDPVRELQPRPSARPVPIEDEDEDEDEQPSRSSELNQVNVEIKRQKLRDMQRQAAIADGKLVPDTEVLSLLSGVMQTFIAELERQETALAASHGREIAAVVRRGRKAAQGAAAARLIELARKHLPPHLAAQAPGLGAEEPAAAA